MGYLCIPKCCSNGIRMHYNFNDTMEYNLVPNHYKIFTIIREPVERFISAYTEVLYPNNRFKLGRFREDIPIEFNGYNTLAVLDALQNNNELSVIDKFLIYLDKIENEWHFYEPHCMPFIYYLTNSESRLYDNLKIFKLTDVADIEHYLGESITGFKNSENSDIKQQILQFVNTHQTVKDRIKMIYHLDVEFYNTH